MASFHTQAPESVIRAFFFLIFFLASVGFPFLASAEGGISLNPVLQQLELKEGDENVRFQAFLTNTTSIPATFSVSAIDFGSLDASGGVAFLGGTGTIEEKYALARWMRLEEERIVVAPGERREVTFRIENAPDLSPGGHYGALIFRSEAGPSVGSGNTIALNQVFSLLVFLKKTGGERFGLELQAVKRDNGSLWALDERMQLDLQNTGNVHVVPRGEVLVFDPFNRAVQKGVINEESGIILPETTRAYPTHILPLRYAFWPGYYRIQVKFRYDGEENSRVYEETFLYLAWPAALLGLLLITTSIWLIRRWRNRVRQTMSS